MRRDGFTLVELLIVIVIISILAAMLLPTLERSLEMARRIECLGEKRQLGLAVFLFADDHNGLVPHAIYDWNNSLGQGRHLDNQLDWTSGSAYNMSLNAGWHTVNPLGTLTAYRYVENPGLYFCSSFNRLTAFDGAVYPAENQWDLTGDVWKMLYDGEAWISNRTQWTGVADFFATRNTAWSDAEVWVKGYTLPNLRLGYIAEKWNKSKYVSPLLISDSTPTYWPASSPLIEDWYTDSVGVTRGPFPYNGFFGGGTPAMYSHNFDGVGGVFIDGSARWISRQNEVVWMSPAGLAANMMATGYNIWGGGNFVTWAKEKATIAPPR